MFATLTNVTVSNQNIFLSSGLGKGASLSRGEWVWTIIIYLVPSDFMNTIMTTELWIHKHRDFFSFIAPLFMCNSIVPTLYRNINPKIIFRKKTVVFIFSLASVDMWVFCVLIPALYLWEVLPINLGYGLSSSHQKTMKVERPHWLYPWSRNTLSDADTTYPGHPLVIRGNWDYLCIFLCVFDIFCKDLSPMVSSCGC